MIDREQGAYNQAVLDCIKKLEEQREIYRQPEFAFPNGCLNSIVTTTGHIRLLKELIDDQPN